jgi:NADPH-dependent curcumin reductase CurA
MPNSYRRLIYAKPMVEDPLSLEQFELREQPLPELKDGQALVRVKLINIHSNTRLRMALGMTALGETEHSNYACAEVVQSRDAAFKEGDVIAWQAGWQDYQIITSADTAIGYPPASRSPIWWVTRSRATSVVDFAPFGDVARMLSGSPLHGDYRGPQESETIHQKLGAEAWAPAA